MSGTNQDLQSYLDSMNEGNESLITLSSDVVEALAGSDVLAQKILTDVIDDGLEEAVEAGETGYFVVQDGDFYFEPKVETQKLKTKPPPSSASKNPSQARTSRSSNALKTFVVSTTLKRKKIVAESDNTEKFDDGEEDDGNKPKYVYIRDHKKRLKPENTNEPDVCEDGKKVYDFDDSEADGREEEDVNDKEYFLPGKVVRLKPSVGSGGADGNGTVYRCLHCSYTASKRFLLSRHMKAHSTDRPYKCSVCERGFKVSASLLNHVNTHLGNKPYACKYCEMCFTTSGEMVRHVRYRHTGEKPHKCTECDYSSVEQSKLRRHMRCHTGERPYQCPHCTYASPDMFKLKRHMRTHTGEKPYECDICHARFTQSNSLKAHRLIHSVGDKPVFQCSFCPTTCGRKTDLRMHIQKLHNSTHPIKCKRCDKELPDRYSYKMHVKTHEGEKCYRCKMCTYASVSVRHLESHMLIHSDQKPFVCNHCNMAFRQRQLLKRHINLSHDMNYVPPTPRAKQHYCPHCNRSFTHKGNLIRHMETHDPDSDAQRQELKLKNGRCTQLRAGVGSSTGTSVSGRASYRLKEPNSDSEGNNGEDFNEDFENLEVDFDCTVVLEDEEEDEEMEDDEAEEHFDTSAEDFNYEIIETVDEDIDQKPVVISTKTSAMKACMALDNEYSSKVKGVLVKTETIEKEFMSVEVNDGQQYMVVEVIQCEEENYDEDEVLDNDDAGNEVGESYITVQSDVNDIDSQLLTPQRTSKTGVENCFGFAEDEIEREDYDMHDAKATIELLHIIDDD